MPHRPSAQSIGFFFGGSSPEHEVSVITGLQRVSRPGFRRYVNADNLPRVLGGLGIALLTTSSGIVTDVEARKSRVGGEVLCHIW